MKFWPFGAAAFFLAAVLNSAGSSDLLGNMSRFKGKWTTPRPGRQRKPSGTKWERLYLIREKREKSCPKSCPPGKFLNSCTCDTCGEGTYTALENSSKKCRICDDCNPDAHQVEVKNCTPEHDTECGCRSGFYRVNDHDGDNKHFSCFPCTDCAGSNKQTKKNCSEQENTECGACLPNFHLQGEGCQENKIVTEKLSGHSNIVYLLLCLPCLLLLGASIVYCKRRCISGESSPVGIHTLVHSARADSLLAAPRAASSPKHKLEEPTGIPFSTSPLQVQCGLLHAEPSPQRSLLQGRKLYNVIDAVPVRRWKEFMRGLGLRDGEIEAVEVEYTQLREQQYEMLKRWRQQQGATVDAIFAVLEDMQLGGCAQELREQLQPSTLPPIL